MKRLLIFIALTTLSYQTAQAACALKSEFENKNSAAADKAKEAMSKEVRVPMLRATDKALAEYFVPEIQSIIRAYALNPLDFVTVLYRQQSIKMEEAAINELGIQPDGTIIIQVIPRGDIRVHDSTGRKLTVKQIPHRHRNDVSVVQKNGTIIEKYGNTITVYRYQQGQWVVISTMAVSEDDQLSSCDAPGIFQTHNYEHNTHCLWNEHDCSPIAQYPPRAGGTFVVVGDGVVIRAEHAGPGRKTLEGEPIYNYVVHNRDKSIRAMGEDTFDKVCPVAMGPNGNFVTCHRGPFDPEAYVRTSNFELRHTLKGHSQGVACGTVCPEGTMLTGSEDQTVRIWNNDGSMRSVLRYGIPVRELAECNGTIVTSYGRNLSISNPDSRLTELLGQFSFAQLQEIKWLIQILEEMYWMKHSSIVKRNTLQYANDIASIELVLFGKPAEIFKRLPAAIQENIMQNMRCKISIEQSNSTQTNNSNS